MIAWTDGLTIATLGVTGGVLVAAIQIIPALLSRKQAKRGADAIGTPNGDGTVVKMLHTVIHNQGVADGRQTDIEQRIGRIEDRQDKINDRVVLLEAHKIQSALDGDH